MKKNLLIALLSVIACLTGVQKSFAIEQVDGVYQINNAEDLEAFSELVASGNNNINAVLTTDIDMSSILSHKPIGTTGSPYSGTFDGQEHYIMSMLIDLPEQEYVGLFGVLSDGAYIKNVIVDWSCMISGLRFVGGIAGGTNGSGTVTFENCGNEASVGATEQNAAGICGVSMLSQCGIVIKNCFNTGGITGARECAAFCGWVGNTGSTITNSYNAGWVVGMDGNNSLWRNGNGKGSNNYDTYGYQGALISEDEYELSSGAVCYQLNGNQSEDVVWYQDLSMDTHPVPFVSHGVVYAVGDLYCDGSSKGGDMIFSNENQSNRDPHEFVDGVCKNCGEVDKDYLPLVDGYYTLSSAKDLNWFAAMVNHGNKKLNARLAADIDFTAYTQQDVMIGGDAYSANENEETMAFEEGIFDGQGHTITIKYNVSYDGVALFKVVRNASIVNLVVEGAIESTGRFIGGLGYVSRGTSLFENNVVAVDISSSYEGDGTHGGFFAVCHESPTFSNCAFVGTMDAPKSEGSAAIIGYAHGSVETLIQNCYVASELLNIVGNSTVFARHVDTMLNCYYTDNILLSGGVCTPIEEAAVASGKLCYLLNTGADSDAWRQDLGTDLYPVPFQSHAMVYANGSMYCDGTMKEDVSYSNTLGEPVRDDHEYVDDICQQCGARIIRNVNQLLALANDVNSGAIDQYIIVDMVEDMDLNGVTDFVGIGTRFDEVTGTNPDTGDPIKEDVKRPFNGYFDGHGHKVSNMIIDVQAQGEGNKGFFGFVQAGSTIKNLVVDNTCEVYSIGWSAGIVGASTGKGILTIENCGNEAMINVGAEGPNGAGILGVNDLSAAFVRIINCFNTGNIVGQRECAAISGWLGDRFEVENCYNSGIVAPESVDGTRTFARYNGNQGSMKNCYEVDGQQVTAAEFDDVISGKLCYLLNEGAGETIYYQTLGSDDHPVLDATHGKVTFDGEQYVNGIKGVISHLSSLTSRYYDVQGRSHNGLQRGINIVRTDDGKVVKVFVK